MKPMLCAIVALTATSAMANDQNGNVAPPEVTHIQQLLPTLPDTATINNFAVQSNVTAATSQLGNAIGSSVSGIGAAATSATQALPNASIINNALPRMR